MMPPRVSSCVGVSPHHTLSHEQSAGGVDSVHPRRCDEARKWKGQIECETYGNMPRLETTPESLLDIVAVYLIVRDSSGLKLGGGVDDDVVVDVGGGLLLGHRVSNVGRMKWKGELVGQGWGVDEEEGRVM